MSALDKIIDNDDPVVRWSADYHQARAELSALRARVSELENDLSRAKAYARDLEADKPATLTPRKCRMQCIAAAEAMREACATTADDWDWRKSGDCANTDIAAAIRTLPVPPCDCNPLEPSRDAVSDDAQQSGESPLSKAYTAIETIRAAIERRYTATNETPLDGYGLEVRRELIADIAG